LILHDRRVRGKLVFATIVFQPLVSAEPDAVAVSINLTPPVARAAARAVALVFRALRFWT
jgi:hypothetical protein